ncbi:MAG: insulinase family protein [Bacteroidota bacterium]|nr:insulinase family protein [Bacteroidota bacterium]
MNLQRLKLSSAFIALSLLLHGLKAQNLDFNSSVPLDPNVKTGVLDNGMKYFIRQNKLPEKRGEFYIVHNVGAIQEEDNQNGLAHFTEHMAFNGTQNFPKKKMLDYLATIGVKFGQNVNAGTGVEQTIYNLSSVPITRESIIDSALLILHDWSNYISFEPSEIDLERGVIREEWRLYGSADQRMWNKMMPLIYKGSKYATRNVIGDTAVINHFKYETITNFYHKWYRPDLQALVVVGDFDVDVMEARIKKLFNSIPAVKDPSPKETYPIPDNVEPLIGIASDPEATSTDIQVYFKHNAVKDENKNLGYMRTQLVQRFINAMFGQRMSEISRKENAPFVYAYCYYGGFTRSKDAFVGYAQARNNEGVKSLSALLVEIERMRRFGFLASEFERAKADVLRGYESAYTDRNKRKNRELVYSNISYFTSNYPNPGIEFQYDFVKKVLPGITLEEINEVASKYVRQDNMVVTVTGPEKQGITLPSEQDIKNVLDTYKSSPISAYVDNLSGKKLLDKEPVPGKVVKTVENKTIGTTEWTLSNGAKVIFKSTDLKDDELLLNGFSAGGISNVKNPDVVSSWFLSGVVSEMGIAGFSRTDLNKMLAGKRVSIYPGISDERDNIRGNMSPKDLETGLQLVYLYFTQPRWNEGDFKVYMDRLKAYFINSQSDPRKAFSDSINVVVNNHDFRSRPMIYKMLEEISLDKIKAIYADRFCDPGNFTFMFTGKINPTEVKPLIEKYLASLPSVKRKDVYKDNGNRPFKGKVVNDFSHENKTPRTSVFVTYNGSCKFALQNNLYMSALRHILELRYIEAIREEKGGTYHVSVSFNLDKLPEEKFSLNISYDTDPKMADTLKAIVYREVKKIVDNGPTEADLQKAKEFFLKQRQENLKENSWLLWVLEEYYYHNFDFMNGYDERVKALNQNVIHDFAKQIFSQGNIAEVIMRPI